MLLYKKLLLMTFGTTYVAPFLIYSHLLTLCHTTTLLSLQFHTVVTSTELGHQT